MISAPDEIILIIALTILTVVSFVSIYRDWKSAKQYHAMERMRLNCED